MVLTNAALGEADYPSGIALVIKMGRMHIGQGEVQVWMASLDLDDATTARLSQLLPPEERARANRFVFDVHRNRFTVMRAVRRVLLARYLGVAPHDIKFVVGPAGKPRVAGELGDEFDFNESRSEGLAAYALSCGRSIGVDLEKVRDIPEADQIIRSFASEIEQGSWSTIPSEMRQIAFLRWWTVKEAYLKALGWGLSVPLSSFTISYSPGSPATILDPLKGTDEASNWSVVELAPAPGFVGMAVTKGSIRVLQQRLWNHVY